MLGMNENDPIEVVRFERFLKKVEKIIRRPVKLLDEEEELALAHYEADDSVELVAELLA